MDLEDFFLTVFIFIFIFFAILLFTVIVKASFEVTQECECKTDDGIEIVCTSNDDDFIIIRDIATDVLYFNYHDGTFHVLMHPDGSPLLYPEWKEMKEATP